MKMTQMTAADLAAAQPFADRIIAMTVNMRGPTVVAGIALALAAAAHMALCGPEAAQMLFTRYYDDLAKAMTKEQTDGAK